MKEEEFFEKLAKEIMKSMAEGLLKSKELSREVDERKDKKEIENNIDKLSLELAHKFIENLKKESLYGKDISKFDFERILKKTIKGHFGNLNENKDNK